MRALSRTGAVTATLLVLTVVAVLVSLSWLARSVPDYTPIGWTTIAIYTLTFALGESMRVDFGSGRTVAPLGMAAGLAFALCMAQEMGPFESDGGVLLVFTVLATLVASFLTHRSGGERIESLLQQATTRIVIVLGTFAAYRALIMLRMPGENFRGGLLFGPDWVNALQMVLLTALATLCYFVLLWASRPRPRGAPRRTSLTDELSDVWAVGAVTAVGAVMVALMDGLVGPFMIPLYLLPVVLMQAAVQRQAEQRMADRRTLQAIGRVTEVTGFTSPGHASRVAALSVRIGRVLGMSDRDLRDLETAAVLHDIGQVGLSRPIPGGATSEVSALDQRRLALGGGGILARTDDLSRLALVVSRQSVPYRTVESLDQAPLAGRVIKVANAWDDLVGTDLDAGLRLRALGRIELGVGNEYDPAVVAALRQVLERRGLLHPEGTGRRARAAAADPDDGA